MNSFDRAYLDVLEEIEHKGFTKGDRTGTGTISRFGTQARFSLKDNRIPMISLRKVFYRSFIHETLWFLSGSTDIEYLKKNNVSIWDSWVKPDTERYRQMTIGEIKTELSKHYGKKVNVLIGLEGTSRVGADSDQEEGYMNIHVVMEESSVTRETLVSGKAEYEAWRIAYLLMREEQLRKEISKQQLEDGWEEVTFVKDEGMEDSWAMEAEVGSSVRQVIHGGLTSLLSLYEYLTGQAFDLEPRVLIGGSIGDGAYGSQWRAWDDTRIVDYAELDSYLERGFEHVGEINNNIGTVVSRKIDQIANVVKQLKNEPDSRRILLVAYNPSRVEDCVLPPCHSFVQWWTRELSLKERERLMSETQNREYMEDITKQVTGEQVHPLTIEQLHAKLTDMGIPSRALSCHLYMRSNDVGVGAVFNIPQYGLLTHMLAQVTGMVAEELIWTNGDSHIYLNHAEGLSELFSREGHIEEARVKLNPEITNIDDFTFEDIEIVNYKCGDTIKFPVAI